ncbi:hypothetical protein EGW08_014912 [Elysia chlorotica]|uniref:G-protein coupled receptors family 1 profile domain-containing protein n=1 Tax=Elysia chlorotica TaxID=188477 RepID=A0A3S0ZGV7_ELYCH|nr:hypothetical protein EGW08_014912 [Elysia chlorotica]
MRNSTSAPVFTTSAPVFTTSAPVFTTSAPVFTITALVYGLGTSSNRPDYDMPEWIFSYIMEYISCAMVTVAFFGLIGNTIIIITLVKMGFATPINISFCALCISDCFYIVAIAWNAICFIPAFANSDLPFRARDVAIPTGGAVGNIFCGTTAWITAYISLERCLCAVFPLKIKKIVSPGKTLFSVCAIFIVTVPFIYLPFYDFVFYTQFDEDKNQTFIGVEKRNTALAKSIHRAHFIYRAVFVYSLPLVIILVCSVALAVSLKRSISWRQRQSSKSVEINNSSQQRSSKDARVVKTVLALATVYIFLGGLSSVRTLVTLMWPEFLVTGPYGRWNRSTASLTSLFSLINSSVNVLIYYKTGSKFRKTVNQMVCLNYGQPQSRFCLRL